MNMTKRIIKFARRLGVDIIGIADVKHFKAAPEDQKPENILPNANTVIVVGIKLLDAVVETAPSREYAIHYMVVNEELNRIAYHLARHIEKMGYEAVPIPASSPYDERNLKGSISHRHAAMLAGIGWIGKSSLLISPEYGPRIRLVSIITAAPLTPNEPFGQNLCGDCNICEKYCPANAIKDNNLNKTACVSYMRKLQKDLGINDLICGICVKVCPYGRKTRKT